MKALKWTITLLWLVIGGVAISSMQPVVTAGENGKDLYKLNCKVCHDKDSANGEYTPMSLTQDQWKAYFKNKFAATHKDVIIPKEQKKLLEALKPEQLKAIEKFAVDHAADSEQPQTCSE